MIPDEKLAEIKKVCEDEIYSANHPDLSLLGTIRVEWIDFLKVATPENLIALIDEVQAARKRSE